MSHIFSAGHRCPAKTNPKSETRNPKRALNSNEKFSKPDQSARPRRLGFADLLLCSLEFVSDFGFRISDFARPFPPNRQCPALDTYLALVKRNVMIRHGQNHRVNRRAINITDGAAL